VLDLSTDVAGPYCAKVFGDFGADVIKVEPPGGEAGRGLEPLLGGQAGPARSGFFAYLNANKRGIVLDLESVKGQAILRDLVRRVDLVIESFPPGYLDERGIGYGALAAVNPAIILTSLTPYGQTGPWRDRPGNDLTAWATSSWAHTNGLPGRPPLRGSGYNASIVAGTAACIATMGAVHYRNRCGVGQQVDVSILEALAGMVGQNYLRVQSLGEAQPPPGRTAGTSLLATSDGYMYLTLSFSHSWREALEELGLMDTDEAERLWTDGRRAEVQALLAEKVQARDKHELFSKLAAMQVVAGMALTTKDMYTDPHLRARGFWIEVNQPGLGPVEMPGPPFLMSKTPFAVRRPAPQPGEHTAEVLRDMLRLTPAEIEDLARAEAE
jgi:crotonobetainyl-CoA:carnitine CoA-transferase CaiB-like acyl-CoA transferase